MGSPSIGGYPEIRICLNSQFMDTLQDSQIEEMCSLGSMCIYARLRSMLPQEVKGGYSECIAPIDEQTLQTSAPMDSSRYKSSNQFVENFTFTRAFGSDTKQFMFFEETMTTTLQNFIAGQNRLVFSYGVTGSGKTFTLQGDDQHPGIIPLSLRLYFASIEDQICEEVLVKPSKFSSVAAISESERNKMKQFKDELLSNYEQEVSPKNAEKPFQIFLCHEFFYKNYFYPQRETSLPADDLVAAEAAVRMKEMGAKSAAAVPGNALYSLWVSCYEIYNEFIYDLLQPLKKRAKLKLGEDNGDVYVKGLSEVHVVNCEEALQLLTVAKKNMSIAATKLNYQSSRSHCVFTVKVIRMHDSDNPLSAKVNRLSFCDLAGSERCTKTQTSGARLKEATNINNSLLVLGRCLELMRNNQVQRDKAVLPFRDSNLTRLISGFFMGTGKAIMITNASPSSYTFDETLHVLRFSAVAKQVLINDTYLSAVSETIQSVTDRLTKRFSISGEQSIIEESMCLDRSYDDDLQDLLTLREEQLEALVEHGKSLERRVWQFEREKVEFEFYVRKQVVAEMSKKSDQFLEDNRRIYEREIADLKRRHAKECQALEEKYKAQIKKLEEELDEMYEDVSDEEGIEDNAENINSDPKVIEVSDSKIKESSNHVGDNSTVESDNSSLKQIKRTKEVTETIGVENKCNDNSKIQKEIAIILKEKSDNVEVINRLSSKLLVSEATIAEQDVKLTSLLGEIKSLQEELSKSLEAVEKVSTLEKEVAENEKDNTDLRLQLAESEFIVNEQNNQINQLFEKITSFENQQSTLTSDELLSLRNKESEDEMKIKKLGVQLHGLETDIYVQDQKIKALSENKKLLEDKLEESEAASKQKFDDLSLKFSYVEKDIDGRDEEIKNMTEEIEMLQAELLDKSKSSEKAVENLYKSEAASKQKFDDLSLKFSFAEKDIDERDEKIKNMAREIELLQAQLSDKIKAAEEAVENLVKSEAESRQKFEDLSLKVSYAEKDIDERDEKIKNLNKHVDMLQVQLLNKNKAAEGAVENLVKSETESKQRLEDLSLRVSHAEKYVYERDEEIKHLTKDVEILQAQLLVKSKAADEAVDKLETIEADSNTTTASLNMQLSGFEITIEEQKRMIECLTGQVAALKDELHVQSEATQELSGLKEQEAENCKQINDLTLQWSESEKNNTELNKKIDSLTDEIATLKGSLKEESETANHLSKLKKNEDSKNLQLSNYEMNIKEQDHVINNLTDQITALKNELLVQSKAMKELSTLMECEADKNVQLSNYETTIKEQDQMIISLTDQITVIKNNLLVQDEAVEELSKFKEHEADKNMQLSNYETTIKEQDQMIISLTDQITALKNDLLIQDEAAVELSRLKELEADNNTELSNYKMTLKEQDEMITSLTDQISVLKTDLLVQSLQSETVQELSRLKEYEVESQNKSIDLNLQLSKSAMIIEERDQEIANLNQNVKDLQSKLQNIYRIVEEFKEQETKSSQKVADLSLKISELDIVINNRDEEIYILTEKLKVLNDQLLEKSETVEECSELKKQEAKISKKIADLTSQLSDSTVLNTELNEKTEKLTDEIRNLKSSLKVASKTDVELFKLKEKEAQSSQKINDLNLQLSQSATANLEHEKKIESLTREIESLKSKLKMQSETVIELSKLKEKEAETSQKAAEFSFKLSELEAVIAARNDKISNMNKELKVLKNQLLEESEAADAELCKLQEKETESIHMINDLTVANSELNETIEGLTSEIKSLKSTLKKEAEKSIELNRLKEQMLALKEKIKAKEQRSCDIQKTDEENHMGEFDANADVSPKKKSYKENKENSEVLDSDKKKASDATSETQRGERRPLRQKQKPSKFYSYDLDEDDDDDDFQENIKPRKNVARSASKCSKSSREVDPDFATIAKTKQQNLDQHMPPPSRIATRKKTEKAVFEKSPLKKLTDYVGSNIRSAVQNAATYLGSPKSPSLTNITRRTVKKIYNPDAAPEFERNAKDALVKKSHQDGETSEGLRRSSRRRR